MGTATQRIPERIVLVVDDEIVLCHLTARVLTDAGFRALQVHSGSEALALLASLSGGVDLIVSDIAMPEMTGVKLAAIVAGRWPTVPVLLISGQGGPVPGYPGELLTKPFTHEALLEAVDRLVPQPQHF